MQKKDDATSGNKLLRLFQFLMANNGRHFQTDLSSRLNCSPQTVIRLMREIEAVVGDSLEYGRDGHRRWYRFKPKQSNRLGLNFAELDFLSVYRDLAAPFLNSEDRVRIDTSLFNFSMLMADPSYQTGITRGANAKFVFTSKGRIDYTGHYETLERLAKALRGSLICLVRYRKAGAAEEREHSFAPGRIVSMNGALYVLGATVTKDASCIKHLISLAVHRIREVTVTDQHFLFEIPEEDLGLFGLPWHEPRNFRIRFAPGGAADYVRERIWSDQQRIVEQEDGGLVLELVSRSEPEVMSWVRSFGEEAELLDKDGDEQEPIANYAQPGGTIVPDFAGMDDMDEMEDLPEAEQGAQPGGDQASKAARSTAAQDGQHGGENAVPAAAPEAASAAGTDASSAAGSTAAPDDAKATVQPWKRIHRPAMRRKAMTRSRNA